MAVGASTRRSKTGCITCRIRKKRCDEAKPLCRTCTRLGIECLGYGAKRPKWLSEKSKADQWRRHIAYSPMHRHEAIQVQKTKRAREESTQSPESDGDLSPVETHDRSSWLSAFDGSSESIPPTRSGRPSAHDGPPWKTPAPFEQVAGAELLNDWDTTFARPNGVPNGFRDDPTHGQSVLLPNDDMTVTIHRTSPQSQSADAAIQDMWKILFGPDTPPPPLPASSPIHQAPPPATHSELTFPLTIFRPMPAASVAPLMAASSSEIPDLGYLHHYLNVVLPLQYRFAFKSMAELVTPLAMSNPQVMSSTSSLAALHLSAQRTNTPFTMLTSETDASFNDVDAIVALTSHKDATDRLNFLSSSDLTSEDVIVSALFAISFHLFCGGTSREWVDVLATARRCLASALASSPEVTPSRAAPANGVSSPWQRYRPLIAVMVWMDILGSVTQNKASPILPTYMRLLDRTPMQRHTDARLDMENVMGCDDTTLLALARTIALSEWKEHAEKAGCLSIKELVQRAASIEKLLAERSWRQSHLDETPDSSSSRRDGERTGLIRFISDIFHSATQVLLATVVNGPYPRVAEVSIAVQDTIAALTLLDISYPQADITRALILPITIAGCHCETLAQRDFFRKRYSSLGPDAAAFGNSSQALALMEEVWRQRDLPEIGPRSKVDFRQTMRDLGWTAGILLI
ncbi:fungal-specific transcription factor domain-domain-containing protein [Kockovaella imperatae]|uniref:Fungal-specific transcription factor domain-domain-containing protein n=1 Tax=Kockovaella imperatae TaxID=4999 RepID=A0A1Y1UHD1_9TREE|nr:fungal-specific transcription factor domain-domain-containing protein [Kockovaella imperatae]ORX36937.1 fungal-specific transcription factor domain-domain-containing protein [Kockovaella imperatae]